jgi:hypothetical protein
MRPLHSFFDQVFMETHYMFPKHKAKFSAKPRSLTKDPPAKSMRIVDEFEGEDRGALVSKDLPLDSHIKSLRESASKGQKSMNLYITIVEFKARQALEDRAELEYLLQKSLKYHREKLSKKDTPVENLNDEEKLRIIMDTWFGKDVNNPAYLIDNIETEARMTTHMILNARNIKEIYPEEMKDAEIDIYLRNRKNVPKYELLQYMKFSSNNDNEQTKETSSQKDRNSTSKDDDDFDVNIGCVNPLTNTRLLLSFKLK